jgi:hypothetical protein
MKVLSRQCNVKFLWCGSPVTIDKRADWGAGAENLQVAPRGAFLKVSGDGVSVTHLVQPNDDLSAPVGWVPSICPGTFDKAPIFVVERVGVERGSVSVVGLDGPMNYEIKEPSVVVCNLVGDVPNLNDCWVQTVANLEKNYFVE